MRTLLINDGRSQGFLTAVVLKRIFSRRGEQVEALFDPIDTRNTHHFWSSTAPQLPRTPVDRVVFCGITFDSSDSEGCIHALNGIANRIGNDVIIVTHRWPDGYANSPFEIWVPPFDLVERFATELDLAELQLLRLSLTISRQASSQFVREEERVLADALSDFIHEDTSRAWTELVNDPQAVLSTFSTAGYRDRKWLDETLEPIESGEYHAYFRLDAKFERRAEKSLEALVSRSDRKLPLAVGLIDATNGPRAYLVRAWPRPTLPSVQWLLTQYGDRHQIFASKWVGRPDAMHLDLQKAGLTTRDIPFFVNHLLEFVKKVGPYERGVCQPPTALSRAIHIAAEEALRRLDVARSLQLDGSIRDLSFDPLRAQLLIERGNRSGDLRRTLVVTLRIHTAKGASFLFSYNCFNLQKLEYQMAGFLGGISARSSAWLNLLEMPSRLRIDTDIGTEIVQQLPEILGNAEEVQVIPYNDAIQRKMLVQGSVIDNALLNSLGADRARLLVYRKSETIGPSVPYAFVATAASTAISLAKRQKIQVLDLFSGSGLSARSTAAIQKGCSVFCVDATVTAGDAGVEDHPYIMWLKGDAGRTVESLEHHFDLICMDPPHQMLFEILFAPRSEGCNSLIDRVSKIAPWLVLYPGHVSQTARCHAVALALKQYYQNIKAWSVGAERILIAGPNDWYGQDFPAMISRTRDHLKQEMEQYELDFSETD